MKKTISILLFISFVIGSTYAQQLNVDSVIHILNTEKLSAENRFNAYNNLCKAYMRHDIHKFLKYSKEGLEYAKKQKDKSWEADFEENMGIGYSMKSNYDSALIHYNKALDLATKIKSLDREMSLYEGIGTLYARQHIYQTGLDYYMKALKISEEIGKEERRMVILGNIGTIHRSLSNYDRAISYLEKSNAIAEKLNLSDKNISFDYNLGTIYLSKKDYDKALEYIEKTLEKSRLNKMTDFEIAALSTLTNIYSSDEKKDYVKALQYAQGSKQLSENFGDPYLMFYCWIDFSNIYYKQGAWKECEDAALKAWAIDSVDIVQGKNIAANITIANIHLGNKERANSFFWKYNDFQNKYIDKNYRESLLDLETKYETEKKELRIVSLEKEKQLYTWLAVLGIVAVILGSGLFFYRNRLNKQKIKQLEQEKQLVATQALLDGETAERSRLARDLHDGLGGLLSVLKLNLSEIKKSSLTKDDEEYFEKASEILDESNKELRRIAHHMMPASLMKAGLKTSLSDFCQAIPGVTFQYQGKDIRLDERLEVTLYRCTYELINNAVKYADATKIDVQLLVKDNLISLSVYDDGIGFDPTSVTTGSGLDNIRARIATFNGKMYISSSEKGTEFTIEIERSW